MLTLFLRPVRQLAQALVAHESPRQIALAVALGMLVGMVPKANLIAVGLGVLLFGLQVNRPAGLAALGLFAWLSPQWDAFADRVGRVVLEWPPAEATFVALYDMPLGPFLGFNNTVVMGQLLIGFYVFYPVYHLSYALTSRLQPPLRKWLLSYRAIRWLYGAEIGAQWGFES
jgi:uncharacterized protein (TIGR03546 family)